MAADGQIKIKVTVDGKDVHVAAGNLKDFESAAKGAGKSGKQMGDDIKQSNTQTKIFSDNLKDIVTGLGLVKIASAAFNVLKDNVGAAISRFDKLNAMPRVLEALGASSDDAERATARLAAGIEGLPTSMDEITGTMQSMFLVFRDADKATDSALALNNALLASGTSGGQAAGAMEQYQQALQKGKPDMMEWRNMQSNMNVALDAIATKLGISINELGNNLRAGKIPMSDFNDLLIEVGSSTGRLGGLAKTMTAGIGTSFNNLKLAVVRGIEVIIRSIDTAMQKFSGKGIAATLDGLKVVIRNVFNVIADAISVIVPIIMGAVTVLKVLIEVIDFLMPIILAAATAFVVWKAALAITSIIESLYIMVLYAIDAIVALTASSAVATGATGLLTKATTALNAAFAANPIGLVVAAVAALVVAVIALVKAFGKGSKAAQENKAAIDELATASEKHVEAVEGTITAYSDQQVERNTTLRAIDEEIRTLERLSAKENKSASDKMLLADKVEYLNSLMEDLNLTYDEEADALNMSTTALKDRADALSSVQSYNDAVAQQSELTMDLAENEELLAQNRELFAETERKYTEGAITDKYAYAKQLKELEDQEKALLETQGYLIEQQGLVNAEVDKYAPIAEKIIKKYKEQKKKADGLVKSAENLTKETKKTTDGIAKNSKEYADNAKKIATNADKYRELSRELDRLSGVQKKTERDMARIQAITDLLNKTNDGLNLSYDRQNGAMNMSSGERQRRIDLIAEEASYSAALERLLEIEEDRYTAESRLAELSDFREEYNEMMASGIPISEEQAEKFAELWAEEENLKEQTQALGEQYGDTLDAMEESAERLDSLKRVYETLSDAQEEALDKMLTSMDDYRSQSQNIFEKIDEGNKTSWQEIMDTLNHNAEVLASYWTNIGILMELGVNDGLIQQLIDAGPKAAGEAAALVEKASLSDADVNEINETYLRAGRIPENVLVAMMKQAGIPVNDETIALVKGIQSTLENTMGNVSWADIAEMIPEGLMKGAFGSKKEDFLASMGQLANDASLRFAQHAEIKSPSQVFVRYGGDLIQGLINGTSGAVEALTRAMLHIKNVTVSQFTSIKQTGITIGYDLVTGIVQGISSNAYRATNAAYSLASSITSTVKGAMRISSPSKVMGEIGEQIVEGLGVGIESEEDSVLKRLGRMISEMLDMFKDITFELPDISTGAVRFGSVNSAAGAAGLAFAGATDSISTARVTNASTGSTGAYDGITQHITINSPEPLTPSEVARLTKNASKQLAMEW